MSASDTPDNVPNAQTPEQSDSQPVLVAETDEPLATERTSHLRLPLYFVAFVGAAAFAVLAWAPWAVPLGRISGERLQNFGALNLDPGVLGVPPFTQSWDPYTLLILWSVFSLIGIFLSPLLWRHTPPLLRRMLLGIYIAWLVLATVLILYYATLPFALPNPQDITAARYTIRIIGGGAPLHIVSLDLSTGWYLAVFALALAWVVPIIPLAVPALRRARSAGSMPPAASAAQPAPRSLPGVGALTIAVVLWAIGVFFMPWATLNCTATPLLIATCTGLTFSSVLGIGIVAHAPALDPLAAQYAVEILLIAGIVLLLIFLWRRVRSREICAWVTLWLVAATFFAIVANAGVGAVVGNRTSFGLPTGMWSGDSASLVTFFALLVGWLAAIALWVSVLRRTRQK